MSSLNKPAAASIDLDIAIIGGGSAGITLASKLNNLSAVVIEPRTPTERDCSWALWADSSQTTQFSSVTKGSWQQWKLVDQDGEVVHNSNQYRYTSLSSAKYLTACENNLANGVELIRELQKILLLPLMMAAHSPRRASITAQHIFTTVGPQ